MPAPPEPPAPPRTPAPPAALDGIRVIDMATVFAGPGAARHLADFGADVIKVESPDGDGVRRMGWFPPEGGDSYTWRLLGRGKRSVVLDLKDDEGREAMQRLIDSADVLIENLRPGTLERLGFPPDELLARNPGLVVLRVTGFGQDGPYAQRPGFATIAEAMSGFAAINGEPDGPPLLPPIALTDEVTALAGAFAVMVALHHRDRTGEGQVVDVNLLESMLQMMSALPSAAAHLGYDQPRLGSGIPYSVPRGTYRTADGKWVAISTSAESVAHRVMPPASAATIPWFDPSSAGVAARVLLLLQDPSGTAAATGFISPDNNDPSARCTTIACREAGLDRDIRLHWNVYPWWVNVPGGSKKKHGALPDPSRPAERWQDASATAAQLTGELFGLLPHLRVVVVLGTQAQTGFRAVEAAGLRLPAHVTKLCGPSLSPPGFHSHRTDAIDVLRQAADIAAATRKP